MATAIDELHRTNSTFMYVGSAIRPKGEGVLTGVGAPRTALPTPLI